MKKVIIYSLAFVVIGFQSCMQQVSEVPTEKVSEEALALMVNAGFDIHNIAPRVFEEGYLVEGDIYLTKDDLTTNLGGSTLDIATEEQYHTNNLVAASGNRVITVYISAADQTANSLVNKAKGGKGKPGGGGGSSAEFPAEYGQALNDAISRYNAENLTITFERVSSATGADIVYSRLRKGDERQGILGSAGFPTSAGNPYGEIKMSGIIQSTYGWSTDAIATVMAHEMGHCVGFRHTDYFNRSVSCGGAASNEGDAGIGANYIPGTPTGASLADASFMLACSNGDNRPFNNDDKVALDYLY